jgi:uncharacterized protein (DUF486 family)
MQGALTILLLTISNIFMTVAWYGHLRFRSAPLWEAIVISWLIASLEYCFQVPANRIGSYEFSAAQLKVIQEVITLIVFSVFSVLYLKQQFQWNYLVAFALMIAAVFFVFTGKNPAQSEHSSSSCALLQAEKIDDFSAGTWLAKLSGQTLSWMNAKTKEVVIDQPHAIPPPQSVSVKQINISGKNSFAPLASADNENDDKH